MANYKTIKELVLNSIQKTCGKIDHETITKLIKEHFPNSEWKKSHWAWYRSQIKTGKIKTNLPSDKQKTLVLFFLRNTTGVNP